MEVKQIFELLYKAGTEKQLEEVIQKHPQTFRDENWYPLGGNMNNYAIIKNQQANPIAALIEKVTNSIDALLMKKALELGIDPESNEAPHSIEEAVKKFFPDHQNWDIADIRRAQAEEIQIVADGPPRDTSVIIYDNGEGQEPEMFEKTFLSLIRGNKVKIHFVQGKYNMGGSGAIVFCGKKRYQLISSKRFNGSSEFGFTLIREHPFTLEEEQHRKETWYEYLKIDGKIPSFIIDEIDLGLNGRMFRSGTVIKLYSYQFPPGYSGFAQDLNQSINEYLFQPALPILTMDTKKRYPNNKVLELDLYGLKRRLEMEERKEEGYIQESFSHDIPNHPEFGKAKITCYVFKAKTKNNDVAKTKENLQRLFFKNNMSVLFSINGQVHGHYTSEFITRSLKMNLLKSHLLIHVDCTHMKYDFKKELFMASRDRLKDSSETRTLRYFLAQELGKAGSRLSEIVKERKNSISIDSSSTKELIANFSKKLPKNSDLYRLLGNTFKLKIPDKNKPSAQPNKDRKKAEEAEPFLPQRFPSFLNLLKKNDGETPVAEIPLGGERVIKLQTDVEDHYFDRSEEPGDLQISILNFRTNSANGGNAHGSPKGLEDLLQVRRESPRKGIIRISLSPADSLNVSDEVQVKVRLNGTGEDFDQLFWVKIGEPNAPKEPVKKDDNKDLPDMGLPELVLVYREKNDDRKDAATWEEVGETLGEAMDYSTVMHPMAAGDRLETIFINMDSRVLMDTKSKKNISSEQMELWDKKYISSVYFHTLFLYTITLKNRYRIHQEKEDGQNDAIDVATYIKGLFDNFYSEFILNFETQDLAEMIGE